MKQRTRIYYSDQQKAMMWDRWQKGESLHDIARLFDRGHSSISGIFAETGGIRPARRTRSLRALTLPEREVISRGLAGHLSMRAIAVQLGRPASTVSREILNQVQNDKLRSLLPDPNTSKILPKSLQQRL